MTAQPTTETVVQENVGAGLRRPGSGEEITVVCVNGVRSDDHAARIGATAVARDRGIDVLGVETAAEALSALEEFGVDCVVSPYRLRSENGLSLLEEVRKRVPKLPFILVPQFGTEEIASRAISAGVTDYLPCDGSDEQVTVLAGKIVSAVENYRTERELQRGYRALETAQEGISILDENGDFVYVNEEYADIYGYDREEMIGEPWESLYPEGHTDDIHDNVLPQVYGQGTWRGLTTGLRADGSTFPEDHSLAETDDGGLVCVVRDVTELRKDARERRRREQHLRELYEITSDPDLDFEEQLDRVLALGCEMFDLGMGMLWKKEGDRFRLVDSRGAPDEFEAGDTTVRPAPGNYCHETVGGDGPVAVEDVSEAGWGDDPLTEEYGLGCFLGAGIAVSEDVYGTLVFTDDDARDREFSEVEITFLDLMRQWVSQGLERERRRTQLAALNEMSRDLMGAETSEAIGERVIAGAAGPLDLPLSAVVLYDPDDGDLKPAATTECGDEVLPLSELCAPGDGLAWDAFVSSEVRTVTDGEASLPEGVSELVAVPLGKHGAFLTATGERFAATDRDCIETTGATLQAALERSERSRLIQQRERTLEEKNEKLERLNRINTVIRNIDQGLVRASSREEIERVVCEYLADVGPYELAWVGTHDEVTGEVVPSEWAGTNGGYLDEITVTVGDEPTAQGPTGRAVATREPQATENALTDPPFEPWRQAALNRGFRSSIALPLLYEGSLYGVLNVYAADPETFRGIERAVLEELSDTVAYAINAVESKKALVGERVVELELDVRDSGLGVVPLTEETGCEFAFERIVPGADGGFRVFFSTRGVPAATVEEHIPDLCVRDLSLVSEYAGEDGPQCLFEATLTGGNVFETVLEHGGVVEEIEGADGEVTATITVGSESDVRGFVETFENAYPESELVGKRERERTLRSRRGFRSDLEETLTDRQLEVLKVAFFSGFFESPRERTGSEVAASLDVSQPTFNNHMRAAQRKLCALLFDDWATPGR
ncbi:GAF domain-containing protein [Halostella sp. JP-L12]|uniref:bacterio-opsin activator domain-containing protein n=1 Tax=Halostella TaxID=1843185 RepID=UPI000EF7D04C|nr:MULTISPECIES: bacterio-opsin activator domain-containing protein [Halostella]NHN48599.1 GAF domain-containing protein [Halostella sp. JP-L12]